MTAQLKPMSSAPTGANLNPGEYDLILAKIKVDPMGGDFGFITVYFDHERGVWILSNPFIAPEARTLIDLDDLEGWIATPDYHPDYKPAQEPRLKPHLSLSAKLKKVIKEHYAETGEQLERIEANWLVFCGTKRELKNITFTLTNQ